MKHSKQNPSAAVRIESLEARQLLAAAAAGVEFRLNSFTNGDQFAPVVASDASGNFVTVWVSDTQDGSQTGIYAQRYNAAGAAQGGEFQVSVYTTGVQSLPSVAMDADGDFVVAWSSQPSDLGTQTAQDGSGAGVYVRRFNSAGVPTTGEIQVNTFTTGNQEAPSVAIDAAGNFVVAWDSIGQDGSSYGVYARRFNSSAVAVSGEFLVNQTTSGLQADPSVAVDRAGDFVIAWTSGSQAAPTAYDIYARRYSAAGVAQGNEFLVNATITADYQTFPAVATDTQGDFVIAWSSYSASGGYDIYARRYNSAGTALGAQFPANFGFTAGNQTAPAVAMDGRGDFVITWTSANQDGSGKGVYARQFDPNGVAGGNESRVNTTTTSNQARPGVTSDTNGDYVIVWQDSSLTSDTSGYGVYAQRFVAPDQVPPTVTSSAFNYLTNQSIVVGFSENAAASISASDVVIQNLTTGTTIADTAKVVNTSAGTSVTITFNNGLLADGNYRVTLLSSGISDQAGNALDGDNNGQAGGDFSFDFFVLAGDANHDRSVNIVDLGILATNWQQSSRNFSTGDFNYDGLVNIVDLGVLAANWQKTLAPPLGVAMFSSAPIASNPAIQTSGAKQQQSSAGKTKTAVALAGDLLV